MDSTTQPNITNEPAMRALQTWWNDESGVTAIEYGLLAALIFVACVAAFTAFGDALTAVFDEWSGAVTNAIT